MIVIIIIGIFIALWFFTMSLEIKIADKKAIDKYHQLRKDIEIMPQYAQWRRSVFAKYGRKCAECDSGENLQIHHRVSLFSILIQNKVISIEQASECESLWNVNNGQVLCKACHDKMESSRNRQAMISKYS